MHQEHRAACDRALLQHATAAHAALDSCMHYLLCADAAADAKASDFDRKHSSPLQAELHLHNMQSARLCSSASTVQAAEARVDCVDCRSAGRQAVSQVQQMTRYAEEEKDGWGGHRGKAQQMTGMHARLWRGKHACNTTTQYACQTTGKHACKTTGEFACSPAAWLPCSVVIWHACLPYHSCACRQACSPGDSHAGSPDDCYGVVERAANLLRYLLGAGWGDRGGFLLLLLHYLLLICISGQTIAHARGFATPDSRSRCCKGAQLNRRCVERLQTWYKLQHHLAGKVLRRCHRLVTYQQSSLQHECMASA